MQGHEVFAALIKQVPGWLDRPIEELVKMRAVGDVYLAAHKRMMKEIRDGKVELAEEDLRNRQADADTIGSAVLDAKVKIGQMSRETKRTEPIHAGRFGGAHQTSEPKKHARLGLGAREMQRFQTLARNPEAIEKVKAEAREYGDPPTETAVLKEIRYQQEKKSTAITKKALAQMTTDEERAQMAEMGAIYLRVRKLRPIAEMSQRGRNECLKMIEKIKSELDSKTWEVQ
jgi:hypothetical protein